MDMGLVRAVLLLARVIMAVFLLRAAEEETKEEEEGMAWAMYFAPSFPSNVKPSNVPKYASRTSGETALHNTIHYTILHVYMMGMYSE